MKKVTYKIYEQYSKINNRIEFRLWQRTKIFGIPIDDSSIGTYWSMDEALEAMKEQKKVYSSLVIHDIG